MRTIKSGRRASLTTLTVLSLGLAVFVSAAWVRSYWRFDSLELTSKQFTCYAITSERGHIEWASIQGAFELTPGFYFEHGSWWTKSDSHTFLGFGWEGGGWNEPPEFAFHWTPLIIPHAFFVVRFAILPATRVRRRLRLRRLAMIGRCAKCGYDLRATPDRCPE